MPRQDHRRPAASGSAGGNDADNRDQAAADFSDALLELLRAYQFRDREQACIFGISVTECYMLELIVTKPGQTVSSLATELGLNKSTTSRAVATLEAKEYVRRDGSKEDARVYEFSGTRRGRGLYDVIRRGMIASQAGLLTQFEPGEIRRIAQLLRELARREPTRSAELSGAPGSGSS